MKHINKNRTLRWLSILAFVSIVFSCSKNDSEVDYTNLENLPKDSGGIQQAVVYNSQVNPLGYYIYTPKGYEKNEAIYPLLVFLHGSGEKGNSMTNPAELSKVLANGPPRLIKDKKWSPRYPMIVVSPQCHDGWWDAAKVHKLIALIVKEYRINSDRIYLTGLSMGGYGTYGYVEAFSDTGYVCAAVPICGGGNTSKALAYKNVPLWAFHGDADPTVNVNNSIDMVKAINAKAPKVKAKLTIYPGIGHDSWSRTYDGKGMGTERTDYDAFNMSIYDWMFQYKKNK